ncbi:MAG: carbamoyl-phosphate synthase large subunit [Planctomycetes bacterium]|nr:carbamoyl-phosphate synthase large subunit [Planctomycetota bacterium]
MPRRQDLESILILGSGPIVIGQACEFDYSGTQACKALREDGFRIILVNSNPATIMTDPETADRTYIEPITPDVVARIIEKERPDAILPTLGGQTALNCAMKLADGGVLERFGVEMIGANRDAIQKAEGRMEFREAMERIGLEVARSRLAYSMDEARKAVAEIGLPCVIRPGFTLGGTGGGIAYNMDEFEAICRNGLDQSMNSELLIEESIIGWKEFELEVMRDRKDNVVVICSIENFDPMGVHTGDSITVAPAQTLTDREYQLMRDAAQRVMREIGVDTGGSNVQFAINPRDGRMIVIEMNPRVSRSSALASKATGFPIAKMAAKLAVGYSLDEIRNDITKVTPASFEPTIDYCVVKFPRWAFEKFPTADSTLTTQMKSVGEVMAIGRTFKEAMQKALRSLETGRSGFGEVPGKPHTKARPVDREEVRANLATPRQHRIDWIRTALLMSMSVDEISDYSGIDPWFLDQLAELVEHERVLADRAQAGLAALDAAFLRETKGLGYSDRQIARAVGGTCTEWQVREHRKALGVLPNYKLVDTCAAEFESYTPYYYSTYEAGEDEVRPITDATTGERKQHVMVLGGGPNRIGQGIEFDYCCVHAAFALSELGFATVMVNSNPETVSTDFDTSDMLFFEPLTHEDVINIVDRIAPRGIIVQFGGQTPLNLARGLQDAGAPLVGTHVDSIDAAEDRDLFARVCRRIGLAQPPSGMASNFAEAEAVAERVGYPVVVRPSFVLGGRAMEIVYERASLERYMERHGAEATSERPILVDKFVEGAIEVDVDAISDGEMVVIGGIMEHIEEAGVHSGDSSCSLPPYSLSEGLIAEIAEATKRLARELKVIGLMNVQYAVQGARLFVLEANPRASRTVPFVSKAIGHPLAKYAARAMLGDRLTAIGFTEQIEPPHFSVKAPVFPFNKFQGVDTILGPEMKSTGEVMGIDKNFGAAFAKAMLGAGIDLPREGTVFLSVRDEDKRFVIGQAARLVNLGLQLVATSGTARTLANSGIPVQRVFKVHEGRPHVLDLIKNREVRLIINTPSGRLERSDDRQIRSSSVSYKVPCITTLAASSATIQALEWIRNRELSVVPLQDYHVQQHATGAPAASGAAVSAPADRARD